MSQDPHVAIFANYAREFGYPPQQPNHLIAFSKKSGVKMSWSAAKKLIQSKPVVSGLDPKSSEKQIVSTTERKVEEQCDGMEMVEKEERVEAADAFSKKYSGDQRVSMEIVPQKEGTKHKLSNSIDKLTAFGWNRESVVKALQSNDGNMCQANEWLMGAQTDDAATAHSAVNSPSVQSPSYSLQSPSSSPAEWSWEKFLDEESSTEHRLTALEHIRDHVHEVVGENVKDNGRVLLGAFATHIRDEDYIHRKYGIRKLAIATVPAVWERCLDTYDDPIDLIENSFSGILDSLYYLLDDNRAKPFHAMVRDCAIKMIGAVATEARPLETVTAICGVLSEKTDLENVNQARCRLFAAKQIFQSIVFKNDSEIIADLFSIDLEDHQNGMDRFDAGIDLHDNDLPQNREYLDLIVAVKWKNNEEETLKDIIADTVGLMMVDPNVDICKIGFNLVVILKAMNPNFERNLEPEATRRFRQYFVEEQAEEMVLSGDGNLSSEKNGNDSVNRKINALRESRPQSRVWLIPQQTDLNISAPSMPDI